MDELLDKIESLLWNPRVDAAPFPLRTLGQLVRFIWAVLRDVTTTTLTLRAMGLVYVTILSIVPLLALSFSVLKGFGFHRQIEPLMQNFLLPMGDRGVEITNQLMGFVDNVKGGVLAGVGLVLLFYTSISMIKKVEDSFNHIWHVDRPRSFLRRFTEYLSILLVGPVIMVAAITTVAGVGSMSIVQEASTFAPIGETITQIGKLTPYILVSLGFTAAYWFIPNTSVKFIPALIGGLTGGVLWAGSGILFTMFVVNSTRNIDIYATFAMFIITLMWLYLSWLILLVGAQVSFYVQHREYLRLGYRQINIGNHLREQVALALMLVVSRAFRNGEKPPRIEAIAMQLRLPNLVIYPVVKRLSSAGLIAQASHNGLLPAKDPGSINLAEIVNAVRGVQQSDIFPAGNWPPEVSKVSDFIQQTLDDALTERSAYDLVDNKLTDEQA